MGMSRTTLQLLLREAVQRPFRGTVVTLGRQHVYFGWNDFLRYARAACVPVDLAVRPELHREPALAKQQFVSDESVLKGLGFSTVVRVDCSDYEQADRLFDLNSATLAPELQAIADTVLDFGTLEHVFHVPNCLRNLQGMLRPGGRILHLSPAANCLDHGFFGFSPTFFADYYAANRFLIHELSLCRYLWKGRVDSPVEVYDYLTPGSTGFDIGSLDDRVYNLWTVVEQTADSTDDTIPQQSFYRRRWGMTASAEERPQASIHEPPGTKADLLLRFTSRWQSAQRIASWLIKTWRRSVNTYRKQSSFPLPKRSVYR